VKTMTLRNIPDDLYRVIVRMAQKNRRSIQQQALCLLDRARALDVESPIVKAANIRKRLQGKALGDTVAEIRQERAR